jgi:aryl-alcohol dehydrogenase-like predicted oxidoreductase
VGAPADRDEAIRVLRRCLDLEVNFIDTADSYGPHVSEELIAEALHPYPRELLIATKGGFERPGPGKWVTNGRPDYLRACVDGSLRRLRVERIDLWQLHRIDDKVPADEQFGAMAELVEAGKVRFLGLSEVTVAQIEAAERVAADRHGAEPLQPRGPRRGGGARPLRARGDRVHPVVPAARGEAGRPGGGAARDRRAAGRDAGAGGARVAAGALAGDAADPGTSRVEHLEQNVAASAITLDADEMARLDAEGRRGGEG